MNFQQFLKGKMGFKGISYFKFLLKSTNQHGIHSPFVFAYLTKCLYLKPNKSQDKTTDVLLKSIPYFNANSIIIRGNDDLKKQIDKDFLKSKEQQTPIDILYFESPLNQDSKTVFSHFKLHNDSLILFRGIYHSLEAFAAWNDFVKSPNVTVSIDLFYCGLLFIRKEQVKQHFTIRI